MLSGELAAKNASKPMTNTIFVGKVYLRFDELPSTNDHARELLAKSKPPEGTVIRAASQSAGRGQYGSRWVSEPGANLTLSVIFYPRFLPVAAQFRLSEAVALAVRDTVDGGRWTVDRPPSTVHRPPSTVRRPPSTVHRPPSTPEASGSTVQIKWPNDIYISGRKTAGILIQNSLSGNYLQSSVVGIGLNVNQLQFPESAPNATSLALATGAPFDLEAVAETILVQIERRYLQLKSGAVAVLRDEYHEHLLGRGEERQFIDKHGRSLTGTIQGVSDDGRLILHTAGGPAFFAVKEIQML